MPVTRDRPLFQLLGFPVHVGRGFVIFMILLAAIHSFDEFGVWLAGAVAGFTLIHELAHAVVARWAGAEASISLEFMAGFTSYSAKRELPRPWTIAISLAGPLTHIAIGAAVVFALGGSPFDRPSTFDSEHVAAVWWAGVMIGLFNLIPVLPLDGGHATMTVLDRIIPGNGERVMLYGSVAVSLAALAATPFVDRLADMTVFIGFLLLIQLQSLFAHRNRSAVSPFDAAVAAWNRGDRGRAVKTVVKALERPSPTNRRPHVLTDEASRDALWALVDALPRPLPHGNPFNEYVLTLLLMRHGAAHEAAEYSASGFAVDRNPLAACGVARAAALLGDEATAAAWLRTAVDTGLPNDQLHALVNEPEFAAVRGGQAIQVLLGPGARPASTPRFT